jgi:hypothetical protein
MKVNNHTTNTSETAYQYMRIVESRGQLTNDVAMMNTFNVVFKINSGSNGRVTPRDLNRMLSDMGSTATRLSDDGLINLGAMISVQKREVGM